MNGTTHLVGGIGAAAVYLLACSTGLIEATIVNQAAGAVVCVASSLFPDIDTPSSAIGRRVKPIAALLKSTLGHRTATHSLLIPAIFCVAGYFLLPSFFWLCAAMSFGLVSHILFDLFNKAGVYLLWPLPIKVSLAGIEVGTPAEMAFRAVAVLTDAALFVPAIYSIIGGAQ